MLFYLISAVFIASGAGSPFAESEVCDSSELNVCVELIPRTPVGLPKNREELDAHCAAYNTGMSCMDAWIKRCLPTDGQKLVQQQIGGARALMRFLCTNDTALRRDTCNSVIKSHEPPCKKRRPYGNDTSPTDQKFLKEPTCWARVSPDWSSCVNELQVAVHDILERSQQLAYFNRNGELCCARDAFMSCVVYAGRSCSSQAGTLLRRMAWVLAQDVAACTAQPRAYCAAPRLSAPILAAFSGLVLYPPRF